MISICARMRRRFGRCNLPYNRQTSDKSSSIPFSLNYPAEPRQQLRRMDDRTMGARSVRKYYLRVPVHHSIPISTLFCVFYALFHEGNEGSKGDTCRKT